MKNNNYRTAMVKKVMGTMAAAGLSAMLLVGCGQSNEDAERARDTVVEGSNIAGVDTNIGNAGAENPSENRTDTEDVAGMENQSGGDQTAESGSGRKPGVGRMGQ